MRPILFSAAGFAVPSWHIFFLCAVGAGFVTLFVVHRLLIGTDRTSEVSLSVPFFLQDLSVLLFFVASVYLGGLLGARLYSFLFFIFFSQAAPEESAGLLGPMTFHGGVLGGGAACVLWMILTRRPQLWAADFGRIFDVLALPLIAGLAVGRIGCLMNGDDFGLPLLPGPAGMLPWWSFAAMDAGAGELRFPTQLQESVFNAFLFCAGLWGLSFQKTNVLIKQNPGVFGAALMALSSLNRFWNEFYRGDFRAVLPGTDVPVSQLLAFIFFVLCSCFVAWRCLLKSRLRVLRSAAS